MSSISQSHNFPITKQEMLYFKMLVIENGLALNSAAIIFEISIS